MNHLKRLASLANYVKSQTSSELDNQFKLKSQTCCMYITKLLHEIGWHTLVLLVLPKQQRMRLKRRQHKKKLKTATWGWFKKWINSHDIHVKMQVCNLVQLVISSIITTPHWIIFGYYQGLKIVVRCFDWHACLCLTFTELPFLICY